MSISGSTLKSGLSDKGKEPIRQPEPPRSNNNSKDDIKVDFYYGDRSKLKAYLI